jgi:hypothetical protein
VHGEGDLLPSLVVDRYGDYLVMQTLSQGMDRLLPDIVSMLIECLAPIGILARNDPKVRALEGLEQKVEVVHGSVPASVTVHEGPVEYDVDLRKGQKTGLFLDQRENRDAAARYARGKLLDCFSYNGGFALRLARQCPEARRDTGDVAARRTRPKRCVITFAREANAFDERDDWSGPARATTPSCSTRPLSLRTRHPCQTRWLATKKSTFARCAF